MSNNNNNNQRRAAEERSRRTRAPVEPKIKTVASASAAAARTKVIEGATAIGRSTRPVLQQSTPAKCVMGRVRTTAFQHQTDVSPAEHFMLDVLTKMRKLERAEEFTRELEVLQNRVNGGAFRYSDDEAAFKKFGEALLEAYDEYCLLYVLLVCCLLCRLFARA